jgi:ADP-ribose pyrophosphatase
MKKKRKVKAWVKESRILFRGRIFQVRRDRVVEPRLPQAGKPTGRPGRAAVVREVVEHRGSVVVLPVFSDGRVLLVRQYRYAVGDFLWELVAGGIEPGEGPLRAARRELREESGYEARRFARLVTFYPTPGFATEKMHLYRATGLRAGSTRPEWDEALEARAFTPEELRRMLRQGELRDGKTLVGVLLHGIGTGQRGAGSE